MIEPGHQQLSIRRQCELLGLPRSTYYFEPALETPENLALMRVIDEQYLRTPFYGSRRMTVVLREKGSVVNRKRVQRLMQIMGLEGLFPGRKTTICEPGHKIYPYLLRGIPITHSNHVWSTDITYIPLRNGYVYLVAVIDWHSRYVLSWRLSNTMSTTFCLEALEAALAHGKPDIFNSDQGSQFTSYAFTQRLLADEIQVSMDGRGRALDNVFIERLWRSVKYEDIYLKHYATVADVYGGLTKYFEFYNHERPHQALSYRTQWETYHKCRSESPELARK